MRILGIESSCDETAAAVYDGTRGLLSNVVSSQVAIHGALRRGGPGACFQGAPEVRRAGGGEGAGGRVVRQGLDRRHIGDVGLRADRLPPGGALL